MEPDGMKNVRTTNVMRNRATRPATMNASRYSRRTARFDGAAGAAGIASPGSVLTVPVAATDAGRRLNASRTNAKMQIRAKSSIGVMKRGGYLTAFFSLMRAA